MIGQALSAARYTVADDRTVHSFHSYFLYPGDPEKPIIYDVENLRDGRSFSTRRVKAIQNGRPIFYLTASYHGDAPGLSTKTQCLMSLGLRTSLLSLNWPHKSLITYQKKLRKTFCGEKPIEMRPVKVVNPLKPHKEEAKQYLWIKANGDMPDNQLIHQYLLGYASDWGFLVTALHPHGVSLMTPKFQVATI